MARGKKVVGEEEMVVAEAPVNENENVQPQAPKAMPAQLNPNDYVRPNPLKDQVVELWGQGKSRAEISKTLGTSHANVYRYTRELEPNGTGGARIGVAANAMVQLEDGTEMLRKDWILQQFENGVSRRDIAAALDVKFNVVYNATKGLKAPKSEDEDAVEEGDAEDEAAALFDDSDEDEADGDEDEDEDEKD